MGTGFDDLDGLSGGKSGGAVSPISPVAPTPPIWDPSAGASSGTASSSSRDRTFPERINAGLIAPPAGPAQQAAEGGIPKPAADALSALYYTPGDILGKPLALAAKATGISETLDAVVSKIDDIPGAGIITGSYARALGNEPLVTAWKKYGRMSGDTKIADEDNPSLGYKMSDLGTDIGRTATLVMLGGLLGGPLGAAIGGAAGLTIAGIGLTAQFLASINPFDDPTTAGNDALNKQMETFLAGEAAASKGFISFENAWKTVTALGGVDYNRPIFNVSDLRNQLLQNGFTEEDLQFILENPDQVGLLSYGKSQYGGGSASLAGMGGVINVIGSGIGAAPKAFQAGTLLSTKGGLLSGAVNMAGKAGQLSQKVIGNLAGVELRTAGLLADRTIDVAEAVKNIERGVIADTTVQGLAGYMSKYSLGASKAVKYYTRTAVGVYGATGIVSALPQEGEFPIGVPRDIAGFVDSVWNYNPLRESELISLGAALDLPTVAHGVNWWRKGIVDIPKGLQGKGAYLERSLVDEIAKSNIPDAGKLSPQAKLEAVHGLFGGAENFSEYVTMLTYQIAARGSSKHGINSVVLPYLEGIKVRAGSALSLQASAQEVGELAAKRAEVLVREGKINGQVLVDTAIDWHNNAGDFAIISGGVSVPNRLAGVHEQWLSWKRAYEPVKRHSAAVGTVVLGVRRSTITKENLAAIESVIDNSNYEKLSDAGKRTFISNLIVTKMPRLIDQELELVGEGTANFFIRAMLPKSELPTKAEILGRIRALKAKAPMYDEVFESEKIREAAAKTDQPGTPVVSTRTGATEVITPVDDILERIGTYGPATSARLATVNPEVTRTVDATQRVLLATNLAPNVAKIETRFGATRGAAKNAVAPLVRLVLDTVQEKTVTAIAALAMSANKDAKNLVLSVTGERMAAMGLMANGTRVSYITATKLDPFKKIILDKIVERAAALGIDVVSDTRSGNITLYFDQLPEAILKDKNFKKIISDLEKAFGDLNPEQIAEPAYIKRYTSGKELIDEARKLETAGAPDPRITTGLDWIERFNAEGTDEARLFEGDVAREARGNRPVNVRGAYSNLIDALSKPGETAVLERAISDWIEAVSAVPASRIGLIADELGDLGNTLRKVVEKNSPLVAELEYVAKQLIDLPEVNGDIALASALAAIDLTTQFASTGERAVLRAKREFVSVEQMERALVDDPEFAQVRRPAAEADEIKQLEDELIASIESGTATQEQKQTFELLQSQTGKLRQEGQFITPSTGSSVRRVASDSIARLREAGFDMQKLVETPNPTVTPVTESVAKANVVRVQSIRNAVGTPEGRGFLVAKLWSPSGINHVPASEAADFLKARGIKGIPDVVDRIDKPAKPVIASNVTPRARARIMAQYDREVVKWQRAVTNNNSAKMKVYDRLFEYVYGFKRSKALEMKNFRPGDLKVSKNIASREDLLELGLQVGDNGEIYRTIEVTGRDGSRMPLAVGDVPFSAFARQTEQAFGIKAGQPETYLEAFRHANWYQDFKKAIELCFGDGPAGKAVLYAFIHSQQAEGVVNGFAAVASVYRSMLLGITDLEQTAKYLRVSKGFKAKQTQALMIGKTKVLSAIAEALRGKSIAYSDGAKKITDFADSFMGKKFRTVLGNAGVDSMPVAVDRHTISNVGFVDMRIAQRAEYANGMNPELTKPGIIGSDWRYEWAVERVNQWTSEANRQQWLGRSDWTAAEIQALGWYHFKKVIGDTSGTVADAVEGSSASVLIDLVPSKNSPTLGKLMPRLDSLSDEQIRAATMDWVNSPEITRLAEENGVAIAARTEEGAQFAQRPTVVGLSRAGSTPTITMDVVGASESITSFLRDLAFAAEQDFAVAWAPLPRGIQNAQDAFKKGIYNARPSVNIPLPGGVSLDSAIETIRKALTTDDVRAIYRDRGMTDAQIDTLFSAGEFRMPFAVVPDTIDGVPHIRIIDTNYDIAAKTNYDVAFERYSVHGHDPALARIGDRITSKLDLPPAVHRNYKTPKFDFHRALAQRYLAAEESVGYDTGRVIEGSLGPSSAYDWTVRTDTGLDDATRSAYQEFINELRAQYDELYRAGYRFDAQAIDPYNTGAEFAGSAGVPADLAGTGDIVRGNKGLLAQADIRDNKHLHVFGSYASNPGMSDEINVIFRAVHDTFGHLTDGYSFGPQGELNALIKHMQMFKSRAARKVALIELGGQNATTNFGFAERLPDGSYGTIRNIDEYNRVKAAGNLVRAEDIKSISARPFATQKSFLVEDEILDAFERAYMPRETALSAAEIAVIKEQATAALANLTEHGNIGSASDDLVAFGGVSNDWAKFPDGKEYKNAEVYAESNLRRIVGARDGSAAAFAPAVAAIQDEFVAARTAETESRYVAGMEGPVGEARRALVSAFEKNAPEATAVHRDGAQYEDVLASFEQVRDTRPLQRRMADIKRSVQEDTILDTGEYVPGLDSIVEMASVYAPPFNVIDEESPLLDAIIKRSYPGTANPITEAEFAARVAEGEITIFRGITRKLPAEFQPSREQSVIRKQLARESAAQMIEGEPFATIGSLYGSSGRGYWATDAYTSGSTFIEKVGGVERPGDALAPQTAEELASTFAYRDWANRGVLVKGTIDTKRANLAKLYPSDESPTQFRRIEMPDGTIIDAVDGRLIRNEEVFSGLQLENQLAGNPMDYNTLTAWSLREGLDGFIVVGGERGAGSYGDQIVIFNGQIINMVDPRLEGGEFNKLRKVSQQAVDSVQKTISASDIREKLVKYWEEERLLDMADEAGLPESWTPAGKSLRKISKDLGMDYEELLNSLESTPESVFSEGGCLIFAEAMRQTYGGKLIGFSHNVPVERNMLTGEVIMSTDIMRVKRGFNKEMTQHVMLQLPDGRFVDSRGVYANIRDAYDSVLSSWRESIPGLREEYTGFGPIVADDVAGTGEGIVRINYDAGITAEIASMMKSRVAPAANDPYMTLPEAARPTPIFQTRSSGLPKSLKVYGTDILRSRLSLDEAVARTGRSEEELIAAATRMQGLFGKNPYGLLDPMVERIQRVIYGDQIPQRVRPEDFDPGAFSYVLNRGFTKKAGLIQEEIDAGKAQSRTWAMEQLEGRPKMMHGMLGYGNYWAAVTDTSSPEAFLMAETYAFRHRNLGVDMPNTGPWENVKTPVTTNKYGAVLPNYASPLMDQQSGVVMQAGLAPDARIFRIKAANEALIDPDILYRSILRGEFGEDYNKLYAETLANHLEKYAAGETATSSTGTLRELAAAISKAIRDGGADQNELLAETALLFDPLRPVLPINNRGMLQRIIYTFYDKYEDFQAGKIATSVPDGSHAIRKFRSEYSVDVSNMVGEMSPGEGFTENWIAAGAMMSGYDALLINTSDGDVINVLNQGALRIVDPTLSGHTMNMARQANTASKAEVLGRTTYLDAGKSIVELFKGKADLSTVIHEMAHSWLQVGWLPDRDLFKIADSLGIVYKKTAAGARKLRIDTRLQEEFAQQFERFVLEGRGADTPLAEQFDMLTAHMQRIYEGMDSSLPEMNPDVALILEKIFESSSAGEVAGVAHGPSTLAALTRAEADLTATGDADLVARLAEMDIEAGNIPGNTPPHWDGRVRGLSADYLKSLEPLQRRLDMENSPYTLTAAPQLSVQPTYIQNASQYVRDAEKWRLTTLGKVMAKLKSDRIFSAIGWLFERPSGIDEARATRQALYSEMVSRGATVQTVNELIAKINDTRRVYLDRFPVQASLKSVGLGDIERAIAEVFETTAERRAMLEKLGGKDEIVRMLERSASRFYKKIDADSINEKGAISRTLARLYRGQQRIPGLRRTIRAVRWTYPLLRFYLDPRWHALNALEADIILGSQFGLRATRFKGAQNTLPDIAFLKHAGMIDERLYAVDPRRAIQEAVAQATGAKDLKLPKGEFSVESLLGEHGGGFHDTRDQRSLAGRFTRALEVARGRNARRIVATLGIDPDEDVMLAAQRALDEHGEMDPYLVNLRKIAAERNRPLSQVLDEELYLIDTIGFDGAMQTLEERVLTYEEREFLRPLLQRLSDMNQESYNNMLALVRGNPNRTNLEKIINNYFLYWPASYMIKATKWLVNTVTTHDGELSGVNVVKMNQLATAHYRLIAEDPEYRRLFEENPAMWRFAGMILPISPVLSEIGVSLSRPVRYVGGALGVFPKYRASNDPAVFFDSVTKLGISYTSEILQEVFDEISGKTK